MVLWDLTKENACLYDLSRGLDHLIHPALYLSFFTNLTCTYYKSCDDVVAPVPSHPWIPTPLHRLGKGIDG